MRIVAQNTSPKLVCPTCELKGRISFRWTGERIEQVCGCCHTVIAWAEGDAG